MSKLESSIAIYKSNAYLPHETRVQILIERHTTSVTHLFVLSCEYDNIKKANVTGVDSTSGSEKHGTCART